MALILLWYFLRDSSCCSVFSITPMNWQYSPMLPYFSLPRFSEIFFTMSSCSSIDSMYSSNLGPRGSLGFLCDLFCLNC